MVEVHLPPPELALYVIGALETPRAEMLERHVLACEVCAAALSREAQLEMRLFELAEHRSSEHSRTRVVAGTRVVREGWRKSAARAAGVGFAGLAAAAAVTLFTVVTARPVGTNPISRDGNASEQSALPEASQGMSRMTLTCPDGADGQPCGVQLAERAYDASSVP